MLPSRPDTVPDLRSDCETAGFAFAAFDRAASLVLSFAFGVLLPGCRSGAFPNFSGSYTPSSALLSSRKPWNEACRRILSAVIRLYCTSATRRGRVQCTPFFERPFGKATVGLPCSIASKRDRNSTSLFVDRKSVV